MTRGVIDGRVLLVLVTLAIACACAAAIALRDWYMRTTDTHTVRALDGRPYNRNQLRGPAMPDQFQPAPIHTRFTQLPPDGYGVESGTVHLVGLGRTDARRVIATGEVCADLQDKHGWWKWVDEKTAATFEDADSADYQPLR